MQETAAAVDTVLDGMVEAATSHAATIRGEGTPPHRIGIKRRREPDDVYARVERLRNRMAPILQEMVDIELTMMGLVGREREIVNLMFDGLEYQEMADLLGLSKFTVDSTAHRIFKKFGVHRREQIVARVFRRKKI